MFYNVKNLIKDVCTYPLEYKLEVRKWFISSFKEKLNLKIIFSCFPILFGISKLFYLKYQDEIVTSVFKKNLPGISSHQVKMSWQTFEHVFSNQLRLETLRVPHSIVNTIEASKKNPLNFYPEKKNLEFLIDSCFKRVDFYNDSVLIKTNSNWDKKQTQLYSGIFTNLHSNPKKQIGNNWYTISPKDFSFIRNKSKNFNYNFDELPLKLHHISVNKNSAVIYHDILVNIPAGKQIRFDKKHEKQKNNFLYEQSNNRIKFKIKLLPQKIKQISEFFPNRKIVHCINTSEISSTKLKGVESLVLYPVISSSNMSVGNISELASVKNEIIHTKLKKNFYSKNILPFQTNTVLNFVSQNLENFECTENQSGNSESTLQENQVATEKANALLNKKAENNSIDTFNIQEDIPSWILNTNQSLELLEFTEEFSCIYNNTNSIPRIMSGYKLADVDNKSNVSLIQEFFYKTSNGLFGKIYKNFIHETWNPTFHISVLKNLVYPIEFLNTKLHPPSFKLLSKLQNIIYFEKYINEDDSIEYIKRTHEVPCILWNRSINEFHIKNNDSLREWIIHFFNSDNPLSDRRETFFGTNTYAFLENNNAIYENKTESYVKVPVLKHSILKRNEKTSAGKKAFREVRLFRALLLPNENRKLDNDSNLIPKKNSFKQVTSPCKIIPGIEYPYIQYLDESEWETFLKEVGEKVEQALPLSCIQHPKSKFINWPLNQFDSQGSNNFNFTFDSFLNFTRLKFHLKQNNLEINYHYFPCSLTLKAYKKNYTIYNKALVKHEILSTINSNKAKTPYQPKTYSFTSSFYECIEPLNSDSWLFITQFSIGFFLLTLLQIIVKKYEGELRDVLSIFLENGGSQSPEFNLDNVEKNNENFRIITNIQTKFHDIAGIDNILPELSEIVWFLKNSGRGFKLAEVIPEAILLTGAPGTGKTLLVQAIAGEAEVPVIMESGSSLIKPETSESGPERLRNLFERARKMAPCIIFIDEIDTFGEARDQVLENSIANDTILDSIYQNIQNSTQNTFQIKNLNFIPHLNTGEVINEKNENLKSNDELHSWTNSSNTILNEINENIQIESKTKQGQRNLLMQFLIELDGIAANKKIMVFGATNRPQILDAALTRPGRFNKILELKLPNKQKRVEILKFYSKNLGIDKTISWNYLANLTRGLSAADLAAVMNQSSMKAIQAETLHTIETVEYGIECITGYTTQKNQLKTFYQSLKNPTCDKLGSSSNNQILFANRLAYYQSGKAIVHTLLKHHPSVISIHLWPQLKNTRYHLMSGIVEKEFSQIYTRVELESRIIGLYGGKAAELLALFHNFQLHGSESDSKFKLFNKVNFSLQERIENKNSTIFNSVNNGEKFLYFAQSDLGIQDSSLASWLAQMMVTKWYFYSRKISTEKFTFLQENLNLETILNPAIFEFLKQSTSHENTRKVSTIQENSQNWITRPWLQMQIINKLEFSFFRENNWFKIYTGDHERNENTKVIPPDKYYHDNVSLNNLLHSKPQLNGISVKMPPKSSVTWNDVNNLNRDYIYHSLIMACFNKAVCILDENRELMDLFASLLMQKEIIREHEILKIVHTFEQNKISFDTQNITRETTNKTTKTSKIIQRFSQKKACRFINFKKINTM